MRLTEARQGIRMLKFLDVFGRWEASELSQLEAAELLGMGERTFRRWSRRYEEEGEAGLLDRRIGKASGKRVPVDRCEEVEALYRTRYQGFTARHFHEHLVREHRFAWSYSWTKTFLQSRNLLAKAPRRGAHRRKRPRRPLPGMMLHQDASRHAWLPQAPPLDLVVTMDDATSEVYSAFLVEEEGTASTFRALLEGIGRHEHAVVIRIKPKQRKRHLLADLTQHRDQHRLLPDQQRRAFRPSCRNVSHRQRLYEAALCCWPTMRDQIRLHEPRRRIIPAIESANRHAAPDSGRQCRAPTRASCRLLFNLAQCPIDRCSAHRHQTVAHFRRKLEMTVPFHRFHQYWHQWPQPLAAHPIRGFPNHN